MENNPHDGGNLSLPQRVGRQERIASSWGKWGTFVPSDKLTSHEYFEKSVSYWEGTDDAVSPLQGEQRLRTIHSRILLSVEEREVLVQEVDAGLSVGRDQGHDRQRECLEGGLLLLQNNNVAERGG